MSFKREKRAKVSEMIRKLSLKGYNAVEIHVEYIALKKNNVHGILVHGQNYKNKKIESYRD
ncbi:hypothetical protein BpHYR1_041782 [Brachionus plicatilis]|uniref:Uncharacterized protein n=1 Tax=Brachionus plicatilis TaxID=10195 RepID=A0A3M7QAY8_BRAPC|nr:hypothetical protein BpHYR1_041782 [Brachionus plicatilis]